MAVCLSLWFKSLSHNCSRKKLVCSVAYLIQNNSNIHTMYVKHLAGYLVTVMGGLQNLCESDLSAPRRCKPAHNMCIDGKLLTVFQQDLMWLCARRFDMELPFNLLNSLNTPIHTYSADITVSEAVFHWLYHRKWGNLYHPLVSTNHVIVTWWYMGLNCTPHLG